MRKTQSALEYLINYGWVFLVLIIMGYLIFGMGVFSHNRPKISKDFTHFQMIDWKVGGRDSEYMAGTMHIVFSYKNPKIKSINSVSFYDEKGDFCGDAVLRSYEVGKMGEETDTGGVLNDSCIGDIGEEYKFNVRINYTARSGLEHVENGVVMYYYEPILGNISLSNWSHSWYGSDIMINEPGSFLGSYKGTCPAEFNNSGFTWVSGGPPLSWNNPSGCSAGECHGPGKTICEDNCTSIAHGWLKAVVTAQREVRGHKLWLWGDATCNSSFTYNHLDQYYWDPYSCPSNKEGFICLDDNLYFYVNKELVGKHGLSYKAYKCNECSESEHWCVPPIELTQFSNFRWNYPNEVLVLVEDWCTGGGMGGMNFRIDPELPN